MKCHRAQQRLMAYHDGELSPGMVRRLEKHLEACPDCSRLLEGLRRADDHVTGSKGFSSMIGVGDVPPPGDRYWNSFTARVLDRVEEDAAERAPDRPSPRRGFNLALARMAPAFSIALVVVVAAGVLIKMGEHRPVPEKTATVLQPREQETAGHMEEAPMEEAAVKGDTDGIRVREEGSQPVGAADEAASGVREAAAIPKAAEPVKGEDIAQRDLAPVVKKNAPPSGQTVAVTEEEGASEPSPGKGTSAAQPPEAEAVPPEPAARQTRPRNPEVPLTSSASRVKEEEQAPVREQVPEEEPSYAGSAEPETAKPQEKTAAYAAPPVPTPALEAKAAAPSVEVIAATSASVETALASEGTTAAGTLEKQDAGAPAALPEDKTTDVQNPPSAPSVANEAVPDQIPEPRINSANTFYRGPQDQLTHARNLAEVRKFWESEQVLKDLLSQSPPVPIQEEASLLLVRVLNSQNRTAEAQRVLDDAKEQFPASERIQTYQLGANGENPVQ